jgi:trehalose-6-phosphate synthase
MSLDKQLKCLNCGLKHNPKVTNINSKIGNLCIGCVVQHLKQYHDSKTIAHFMNLELGEVNKHWFIIRQEFDKLEDE